MIVNNYYANNQVYKRCSKCGRSACHGQTLCGENPRMYGRVEIIPGAQAKPILRPRPPLTSPAAQAIVTDSPTNPVDPPAEARNFATALEEQPKCAGMEGGCAPETEPILVEDACGPVDAPPCGGDYMIGEACGCAEPTENYMTGEACGFDQIPVENCMEEMEDEPICPLHLLKEGMFGRGLYHYKKWWERSDADIVVNGVMISGITIFTDENTLRVVNEKYSYFIPLEKVDFIRTADGLCKNP